MNKINTRQSRKIGIDARFYGPIGKGLGRYTQEIVDGLIKIDQQNEYIIFLRKDNFDEFKTDNPRVKKIMTDVRWYTLAEQILMPFYIWRAKVDLMHFPHFNVPIFCPTKFVVTIHDLILVRFPTRRASRLGPLMYKIKNFGYKIVIWWAVMRSKKIITVSEFTKKDILGIFKIDSNKIAVTLEGVASSINSGHNIDDDKKVILSYNIHKPYLLYVGNAYPHKNLEVLISILPKIREEKPDIQLVFVGKDDFFYQQLKKLARTKGLLSENNGRKLALIFAGFVPDKDLDVFYREAELYVFPSLYEGFGLPPLEAMSKGLPVVSSDKSCLPEILGDAALYFDATDEKDIIDKILFILKDDKLRKNYSELGRQQAKKYSWPSCVERTLAVFNKEILNE